MRLVFARPAARKRAVCGSTLPKNKRPAVRPNEPPTKKAPAASAFWVYFESRLERYRPSTIDPLCADHPIAFWEPVASAPH